MKLRSKSLLLVALLATMVLFIGSGVVAFARDADTEVVGKIYTFDKDAHYEFSFTKKHASSDNADTYGAFTVGGAISETTEKDGVPAFMVPEGELSLHYTCANTLLSAGEDEWHLVDESSKKLDTMVLSDRIGKGAIIVQTSKDRVNWVSVKESLNCFEANPVNSEPIYITQEIELINGCFYRVIVAYELGVRTKESKAIIFDTSTYDYNKVAEVYEFFACSPGVDVNAPDPNQTYNLGSTVRVEKSSGYKTMIEMANDDPHYGITIGQFFVSGYTDKQPGDNGNIIFLKNAGDRVLLWFKLNENISAIGGNSKISVTPDREGQDKYFQTPKMDFGRGALIIRYTDHNNKSTEPQIYTNFLEANTQVGADTKISLFEEGDYEVALDYEITDSSFLGPENHYRIFFTFSIRNGNCMVFPFDLGNNAELTNSSMTETGFRLDLARSRYLRINIKREMLTDTADGLVEDTRFNGPAKDGSEYRDDGIYTITATNQYTDAETVKKIYVGTNSILRAYMTTGLSIPQINYMVEQGGKILEDGTIVMPEPTATVNAAPEAAASPTIPPYTPGVVYGSADTGIDYTVIAIAGVATAAVLILIISIVSKKKKAFSVVDHRTPAGPESVPDNAEDQTAEPNEGDREE